MKSYPIRSIYLLFVILSHEERVISFSLENGQLVLKFRPHEKLPNQKYLPAVCHSQPWGESYLFLSVDWTVGSQAPPTLKVTQSEVFTCCLSFSAMRRELSLSLCRLDSWFSCSSHMKSYPIRSIYLLFVILSHEERVVSFSLENGQLVLKLLPHEKLPNQKYLPAVYHSAMRRELSRSLCTLDSWFSSSSHMKRYPIRSIYLLFVILSHEERVISFSLEIGQLVLKLLLLLLKLTNHIFLLHGMMVKDGFSVVL